ncbi:orotidine-5'-phosphate decarboxylase [Nocardioides donggukensis]|uniref:Orotidine 5'-phosphate decarboxylase n=1 Tax=Nocardioides donggukensis TaxID=2774019 RepID=A0A927K444_9ACTN|nr:orotidine-5'-phosphate decarboxylase [Nocardioides donggukensis]MBD8869737.1 orotidine-5'-phosphate decarboxylase [Nocardioides donggukensis]
MTDPFGARLRAATDARGPFCPGIDPHAALLHAWGLDDTPDGLERFARTAVEALAPVSAILKPQAAFFERHGSRGIVVLERVLADARDAGALVLLDVKRGDIGSTAQAYADAYLDRSSPLAADAMTVSPFLGLGSVQPFVDAAREHGAGLFLLALTSNPGADQVQHARASGGTVAGSVLAGLAELNRGQDPIGSYGAVVGATIGSTEEELAINGPLLAPGVGAQGGTAADVRRIFGASLPDVLPSSSREVLGAGPEPARLRDAVLRANDEYVALLGGVR